MISIQGSSLFFALLLVGKAKRGAPVPRNSPLLVGVCSYSPATDTSAALATVPCIS